MGNDKKMYTVTYLKNAISELQRLSRELGQLKNCLKQGNQIQSTNNLIEVIISARGRNLLNTIELRTSLVGRVRRNVMNKIQAEDLIQTTEQEDAIHQLTIFEKVLKMQLGQNLMEKEKLSVEKTLD